VFNAGLPWAEELARYCGLGVVYLTVPLLLLHDKHIKVELLPAGWGRRKWTL
jgi:TRAP-type C4-dicarboxylate transport system permease small subunit